LFKVMAIKDEYEVARLFSDGSFAKQLAVTFEGDWRLEFHLAPPILGKKDPNTGLPIKTTFGPWMMKAFRLLAGLRGLRGTLLDPFSYSRERKAERQLMEDFMALIEELSGSLNLENHATAVALAELPLKIRGFGYVKERHMIAAKAEEAELLRRFRSDRSAVVKEAAE
jgi:indolepyruvate ferredoxin oxidoreductase